MYSLLTDCLDSRLKFVTEEGLSRATPLWEEQGQARLLRNSAGPTGMRSTWDEVAVV